MKVFSLQTLGLISLFAFTAVLSTILILEEQRGVLTPLGTSIQENIEHVSRIVTTSTPTPSPIQVPLSHIIPQRHHAFQSFNNCGPATLSMALSYWDINKSQQELGDVLRPYQVPGGDNDDKSVTLQEVADHAETYGLTSYLRPNGTPEKLQQFLANDIPIITRTWLKPNEDIGHYRVIRGYDKTSGEFIQDDSLQGANLRYSYSEFDDIWQPFNYEYLIIVPENKKDVVEQILGDELDEKTAWKNALMRIESEIDTNPDNWHLTFAKSRIYYYLNDYERSIEEFEKVESRLSFRTLWYQIEPIRAYFEIGNYDRVFALSDQILNNHNRAFSELYFIRGQIYRKQGNTAAAKNEFETALRYKHNYTPARKALDEL